MDERTRRYYEEHARELVPAYDSVRGGIAAHFSQAFPRGGRVLDIGSGSGRDAAGLVAEGFEAWGVEPIEAFRQASVERHPELSARVLGGALPDELPAAVVLGGRFDGVLLAAVLQHLPRHRIIEAVLSLKDLLLPGGRALVSVPLDRPGLSTDDRDDRGRLFTRLAPSELQLLFERAGFALLDSWQDADARGRPGHSWSVLLFRLDSTDRSRPIDRIEAVLSRDKKVATYKLALVRALAETALTQPHLASVRPDGRIALPLVCVAEKWVRYYWPLLSSQNFLPQREGDWKSRSHGLRFAGELLRVIERYRNDGGLETYLMALRTGQVTANARSLHAALMRKTLLAIREGPVVHAGARSGSGRLFASEGGTLVLDPALWRELCLMGHWIQDAVVLRWAEETSRLSSREVPPSAVVDLLLSSSDPEREQKDAREIHGARPGLRCIWTLRPLTVRTMAIDHVIPFSLWRNNDLWNLLPAERAVNASKSDLLPERGLLRERERRDAILECWTAARERLPARFDHEVATWTGTRSVAPEDLFDRVCESVEFTALQRGTGRWKPRMTLQ